MIKYALTICFLVGSNIVTASVLPATIVRSLAPVIKSCTALVAVPKCESLKPAPQEVCKALLQEEKRLNGQHIEWTRHIEILKSAIQAAKNEQAIVTKQLCWIKAAQARTCNQPVDERQKSPFEGKDLSALAKEEHSIINRILSIKEVTIDLSNPSPNGSFWNSQRCAEASVQYEIRLRELYRNLEDIKAYRKTLEGKEQNND